MSDIGAEVLDWITAFAGRLGADPPSEELVAEILALASVAANASARQAAPVACWLAAAAGKTPAEATELARELAG